MAREDDVIRVLPPLCFVTRKRNPSAVSFACLVIGPRVTNFIRGLFDSFFFFNLFMVRWIAVFFWGGGAIIQSKIFTISFPTLRINVRSYLLIYARSVEECAVCWLG